MLDFLVVFIAGMIVVHVDRTSWIGGECDVGNFKYKVGDDDVASYTCTVENPIR